MQWAVHVSVGLRSCVAAPNLRLSTQYQIHRQIAAPPSGTSGSRAVPAAGARNDDAHVTARHEAISLFSSSRYPLGTGRKRSDLPASMQADSTRDASLCHTVLPDEQHFLRFKAIMAKRWVGICQCWVALLRRCTQPTTTRYKIHRQIATPPSRGSKHRAAPAAGARKDKLRPVTSTLFRASCTTRCAVTARPFANEQYAFRPRAVWQRVVAVCISRPAIQGNASKKKTTGRSHKGCFAMPRPLPAVPNIVHLRQRGLAKTNPGRSQHALFRASCVTRCAVTAKPFANEQYAFRPRAVWQRVAAVCLSILFSRGLHTLTRKLHKRQIATLFCRGLRRPTFTLFGKTARKDKNADCAAVLLGNPFCWSIKK